MTTDSPGWATTDVDRAALAIVAIASLAVLAIALAPAATADPHGDGPTAYVIEQDDQCIPVDPIDDTDQSVEEFYDYRESNPGSDTFSSWGTTEYQEDNTSTLMLYRGANGTSLVFVHEKLHKSAEDGTLGSSATLNVTGISPGDGWAVEDDDYEGQDDVFVHEDTYSRMTWVWGEGRTDGGAYRGLDENTDIGIDPAFNDEADKRKNGQYAGYVRNWTVVTETASGFDRFTLDNLYQDVTIRSDHCAPPSATLNVYGPAPGIGTEVTLDASDSTAAANATYRWDLTGDGTVDRTTRTPEIEHSYSTPGNRTVSVTITDGHERTDTASAPVDVADSTPPTARVDAPANATAGEAITVSAAASTDDHEIDHYLYEFGDGTTVGGANGSADPTVTHTYDEPGTYEITATVGDPSGNENATTATVVVEPPPEPPVANLSVPPTATVGEPVTLDASGSTFGDDATFEWLVDGETATTDSPTNETSFAEPGEYTVGVVVEDDGGSDETETTIQVVPALGANVTANRTTVDVGDAIEFEAGDLTDDVTGYEWDFDDGRHVDPDATTANRTITHRYGEPGNYTVTLTVHGPLGTANATIAVNVTAAPEPGPSEPDAALFAPANATVNETVTLDASASSYGDDATFEWLLDGETATVTDAPTNDVSFADAGPHEVGVVVRDDGGNDSATATVAVANGSDGDGSDGDGKEGGGDDDGDSDDGGGSGPPPRPPDPDPPEPDPPEDPDPPDEPEPPEEPIEPTVAIEDGVVVVTADGVDGGETFAVTVPANASDASSPVALRSIEVTAARAGNLTIAFEPAERAVPGRFAQPAAYVPNASAAIERVRYGFGVDRGALDAAGVDPANLTVYAENGDWTALETPVGEGNTSDDVRDDRDDAPTDGDRVVASATVEGGEPVGVGAVGPVLFVEDAHTTGPVADGAVDLVAIVRNTGTQSGEWTLPIETGGERIERSVALAGGDGTTVSARVSLAETAGTVRVGGVSTPVAAVTVRDLEVGPAEPAPNESIGVEALLVNRGAATTNFEATLVVDGDAVASKRIRIAPGDRGTVAFDQRLGTAGTYELAVGNATTTVRVRERDGFESLSSGGSDPTPGLGVPVALVAVALAILGRRRVGG